MKQRRIAFGAVVGSAFLVVVAFLLPISLGFRIMLLLLAAVISAAGCLLFFPLLLEKITLPHKAREMVETLGEELADDLDDLQARRMTPAQIYVVSTLFLSIIFVWLVLTYRKLGATWLGVPVLVFAALAVVIAAERMIRSNWFRFRRIRTPTRAFLIPLAGLLIATSLGIYMTEPLEKEGSSAYERSVGTDDERSTGDRNEERSTSTYSYRQTRANYFYLDLIGEGAQFGSGIFGLADSDEGAIILLIIVLVIVVVVLILGSCAIPHFWVLAGFVLLTCMGMISLRELRVRPEDLTG